ncbi:MAG: hypothetical protein HOE80_03900 [Candidatus Magasanikbacteria bacterium]|jgi:Kef-type K+ transport system membrane component KefB|nr:hypothetical protein [Candidatus Magasanikbacteria bacterium]MBT4071839.1 hypothetical protein [Candidatus Magasanikbacteria bacterium]
MLDTIFLQVSVLLGLTVTIAFFMRLLRQPLLVAYIIAGIVAGPFVLDILQGDKELFHAFAEFGIVLLLFVVGLSLNFSHIKKIGKTSLIVGISQVTFTAGIGFLILQFFHFSLFSAIYLAIAITFSSTIVIVKLLSDKKDTASVYGRNVFGLMIVQDIVAVTIMIVLNQMGTAGFGWGILNLFIMKIVLLIALVFFLARFVLPRILDSVAKSGEFLFIFTLAWCFGVASFLYWLGFSVEIGAIIAGLSLGSSDYQPEISSRIKPLRDFFIIIFFIILGSEMSLASIGDVALPAMVLSLFILIGNPLILFVLFRMFKFTRRTSFLAGTTAAQVSEFGFILLFTGMQFGYVTGFEVQIFTVVALTTIIISSYVITYNEQVYRFMMPFFALFGKDKYSQKKEKIPQYDVLVFGYHRIGWKVCEALAEKKISYAVIDFNPESIAKLKRRGIPAYFGDAADVEFLMQLPLEKAKMVISTLPEVDDQITLTKYIRSHTKKTRIIVNLYHIESRDEMYAAGADYVMMPHLLGGNWIAGVIKEKPWTKKTFGDMKKLQQSEMRLRYTVGADM